MRTIICQTWRKDTSRQSWVRAALTISAASDMADRARRRVMGRIAISFELYALDVATLGLPAGARRAQIDTAMRGHILAEAQYMGRYERR